MNAQELINTVLELRQAVNGGQQREAQLRAQVEQLVQVGTEAQQREQQLRAQVEQLTQQVQNPGPGSLQAVVGQAFQAMAQSQKDLIDGLKQKEERNVTLFDTKGLAKPEKFGGKEESFLYWRTKLESVHRFGLP